MPVFNADKYLAEAIESILNQTFVDFEFIILNDKSTDSSLKIIREYEKKDSRILVIDKELNVGPALLRNQGIDIAKGEFIVLMDADDVSMPTRFEKQLDVFENNSEIGVCGTWFTLFGSQIKSTLIKHAEFHEELKVKFLVDSCIGNPTVMIRKMALNNERFSPFFVPIEDYELWSRLVHKTKFYNIQESLLNYRWHNSNISQTKRKNLDFKHKTIKVNQLIDFGLNHESLNLENYFNAISYSKKQNSENFFEILMLKNELIFKNRLLKKYDLNIFEKQLNETAQKTFRKIINPDIKLFNHFKTTEPNNFKKLKLKHKINIYLRSKFSLSKS